MTCPLTRWPLSHGGGLRPYPSLAGVSPLVLAHLMSGLSSLPGQPLLLAAAAVAQRLGISERHLWAMHSSGRLGPLPLRFGRAVRWIAAEIEAWIAADAPPRDRWLAMRRDHAHAT